MPNWSPEPSQLVARCPTCQSVADHRLEGRFYRCASCAGDHDLLAGLA